MKPPKGLFILGFDAYNAVYAPHAALEICKRVEILAPPLARSKAIGHPELLAEMELLFSGWGAPRVDQAFLDAAPKLKAIFYAGGAINGWATPAVWERGIVVTTANRANAIPVAEYTLATILFSLKHGWRLACDKSSTRGFQVRPEIPGNYHSVIGLIGVGTVGRLVVQMLAPFDMTILAYDPFLSPKDAQRLGVKCVELEELFSLADVVSLHAPNLPSTAGMIDAGLLDRMRHGTTFINTARGRVVREADLISVLQRRPDLQAVLDVTEHEPLPPDSPLNALPNVVLTPHIAGSQGRECQRMGQYMLDELDRYLTGRPLLWEAMRENLTHSVHQLAHA
jgi:phosphoglycerate dehydrogenase-like enzyme